MSATLDRVKNGMTKTGHLSKSLLKAKIERVPFDETSVEHRAAYLIFSQTGTWIIHFQLEEGHASVDHMVKTKLLDFLLRNEFTQKAAVKLQEKYNATHRPVRVEDAAPQPTVKVEILPLNKVA